MVFLKKKLTSERHYMAKDDEVRSNPHTAIHTPGEGQPTNARLQTSKHLRNLRDMRCPGV